MTSSHLVLGAGGMLLVIGLVMVFSASAVSAAMDNEPAWAPGVRQLVFAAIGLVAMFAAIRLPISTIRRWCGRAMLASVFSLVLVLLIGVELNGAKQWFDLKVVLLQPSEIAKLVFALWGAHVLATRDRYLTTKSLLVPVLPVYGVCVALLMLEPDLGGSVSLGLVVAGLLWAGGLPLRYWVGLIAAGVGAVAYLATSASYRAERITSFLNPFADPTGDGYQAIKGLYALATGGFWGVGLGNSRMKWDLLPEAESDYIFAIIGEELGFLGCLVVISLYGVLAYTGFRIARRSTDRFVQVASVAITVWLIGQATMNMGYVVGLLPVTGVQLPLISAGGTSLVLTLFIVGLLTRFARSEPGAVEWARTAERSRLARLLLPVPAQAVDTRHVRRPAGSPARGSSRGPVREPVGARPAGPDRPGQRRAPRPRPAADPGALDRESVV
ncbi:putative lipid II flippase FtsW [Modestobacter sp. I12A-02628]|nr:putative lipid II flippase FtsW [Goekera deserti]